MIQIMVDQLIAEGAAKRSPLDAALAVQEETSVVLNGIMSTDFNTHSVATLGVCTQIRWAHESAVKFGVESALSFTNGSCR